MFYTYRIFKILILILKAPIYPISENVSISWDWINFKKENELQIVHENVSNQFQQPRALSMWQSFLHFLIIIVGATQYKVHNSPVFRKFCKVKLFYNQGRSILYSQLFLLILTGKNCPINFKLFMMISITVRYDLERVETL